jgi:hypothetical protein
MAGCHDFRDLAASSRFPPIKAARRHRYLCAPSHEKRLLTGFAENAVIGNGILGPGMQVMSKPFPLETFALRIRELLESAQPC